VAKVPGQENRKTFSSSWLEASNNETQTTPKGYNFRVSQITIICRNTN